jgi:hypothetical protein
MTLGRIIGYVLLCFIVGVILTMCDVRPQDLLTNTWATIRSIVDLSIGTLSWAFKYILLGAVVVVPIAVVGYLLRLGRGRG